MARYQAVEHQKVTASTSSGSTPINFEGGIQELYVVADGEVTISFDQPAVDRSEGIVINANLAPARFVFAGGNIQNIYAVAHSSTANVYLTGVRGSVR